MSQAELPPTYGDCADAAAELPLPPATLYVAGRFIHSSDPQAPPLYEFSHSIGFLRESDRNVRVERLDHAIREVNGVPQLATRKKHLFNIKHPTMAEWSAFEYYAETTSRDALCSLGLEQFRAKRLSRARGYRVLRTARGPPPERKLIPKDELFSALPPRGGGRSAVAFEWRDAQGRMVAREVDEDGLLRLVVGVEMGAKLRDVLVTAWIGRIWWELAKGNHRSNKWEEVKRIMAADNPELSHLGRGRML